MTDDISRRDFLAGAASLAAAAQLPIGAVQAPQAAAKAAVVVFQGDSVTESGRNLESADPNTASGLGNGYPLLVASAVLAARPASGLRFYNRGVSGNKVPDLRQRWTTDTLDLHPDVLSILIGVNDFWHKLDRGYNGTVQDYEQQYTALLDETRRALPRVHLIVLEPFALRTGAVDARWYPEFDQRRDGARGDPGPCDVRPVAGDFQSAGPYGAPRILGNRRGPSHSGGARGDRGALASCGAIIDGDFDKNR